MNASFLRRITLTALLGAACGLLLSSPPGSVETLPQQQLTSIPPTSISANPTARAKLSRLHTELTHGRPQYPRALTEALAAQDYALCKLLLTLLAQADPAAALDWVQHQQKDESTWRSPSRHIQWQRIVARAWAAQDPRAAMAAFLRAPDHGSIPAWEIFQTAWSQDPTLAKSLLTQFPIAFGHDESSDLLQTPELRIAVSSAIASLPAGATRAHCVDQMMDQWIGHLDDRMDNEETVRAALQWLRSSGPAIMLEGLPKLISEMEMSDVTASMISPEDVRAIMQSLQGQGLLAKEWGKTYGQSLAFWTTPQAALEWAEQLPAGERQDVRCCAFEQWADKDATAALSAASALPAGSEREDIIPSICHWLTMDMDVTPASEEFTSLLAWVTALPLTDPARATSLANVAGVWARSDPEGAFSFIKQAQPGEITERFLNSFQNQCPTFSRDILLALTENSALPQDEHTADSAARNVIEKDGADAAETFLRSLPTGVARAAIVRKLVDDLWPQDPAAAIRLARSLSPEDLPTVQASLNAVGYPQDEAARYKAELGLQR
jgi:hypothetical protein